MPRDINTLSAQKISSTVPYYSHNLRMSLFTQAGRRAVRASYGALMLLALACMALNGCGSGGYAGGGITSLSSSAITIDAGQAFQLEAAISGNALVSWSMAGSCSRAASGAACGAL